MTLCSPSAYVLSLYNIANNMNPEQTASLGSGRMINQLQSKISQKCPKTKQSIRIFNFPEDVQRGEVQINKSE